MRHRLTVSHNAPRSQHPNRNVYSRLNCSKLMSACRRSAGRLFQSLVSVGKSYICDLCSIAITHVTRYDSHVFTRSLPHTFVF